ncbi:cell division protein ZapE [Ferrimicrobium sp.]|uniref:cell division protein ZapE n=1 Tax=Ferrimicrobium sp. TaxID=2926050 RepID=UPI00260347D6|nr:cell division protein ZapE [Ferrimicrobium sp.]
MEMLLGRPALAPTHEELIAALAPPRAFADASFDSYRPDHRFPSQVRAKEVLVACAAASTTEDRLRRFWRRSTGERSVGWYLDGGFGVGKTHLLAATFHAWRGRKFYASFSELTSLVGALSFKGALQLLQGATLLAIDEFELDDPGDTVLISRLADELLLGGTNLVVTSNTLPDRLGEGRFGADDFLREIQGLARAFRVLSIEGGDFRRRSFAPDRVESEIGSCPESAVQIELDVLLRQLRRVHPIRYRGVVQGLEAVAIQEARTIELQSDALRFCRLVDVLYDYGVAVHMQGGGELGSLFPESFLAGGFRQKYGRCLSRLYELARVEAASIQRNGEGGPRSA